MLIPAPGSKIQPQKGGGRIFLSLFLSINFTKLLIILFLNRYRKKFEPIEKELK
jgi:hypothetical protein